MCVYKEQRELLLIQNFLWDSWIVLTSKPRGPVVHSDITEFDLKSVCVCGRETSRKIHAFMIARSLHKWHVHVLFVRVLESLRAFTRSHCSSCLFHSGQGGGHCVRYSGGFCQQVQNTKGPDQIEGDDNSKSIISHTASVGVQFI